MLQLAVVRTVHVLAAFERGRRDRDAADGGRTPLRERSMHGEFAVPGGGRAGTAGRITAAYVVVGCLWILLSDQALMILVGDAAAAARYQTVKGWFYIAISAALL